MLTRTCARACACADTETYCELVANHVAGLRASAPGCSILFGIETVSTFTSITLERFLKRDERASANMYFVREDRTKGGAPDIGIYTSAAIKESAVHLINLFLRKQCIVAHKPQNQNNRLKELHGALDVSRRRFNKTLKRKFLKH